MTATHTLSPRLRQLFIGAAVTLVLTIPGAFAQEVAAPSGTGAPQGGEIQQFCTNIADAARDQRYLLQKQQIEQLQAGVDERIALLEKKRAEYEDWRKRRDEFLKQAELNLVDIYKTMKPDAAASKLTLVRSEIAAAVIMKLPPRQSSLILSEMSDEKAAILTNIISSAADPNTSKEPS
ncbi:flagellar motility protein MotE (MotC chaperone) [Rhizobium sp. PP-F2F-G38]|uniref:MotE family protein n=1 Tax=Rhizobium sp. PP-CC-3G-465 TaxID=2135648 RepID=UPI000D899378|nr:flagellar motility protein MotE (MotC chaperone) [Rhizobium sp. PP-WC-1G-195]PYE99847.1 flagellar motility protein MotE (MotC chaperone) [Rhizobium sp. PP-F2F-G38]TCQ11949.1 flagellar motility protein MotE (MotC chaperone) [Rhizobium sp. PP-F2F-G36]TCQ29265.1 flagellar motility protein MotE (MotC chaperone) [Rhizobium sp. PP-CC-3G-465]